MWLAVEACRIWTSVGRCLHRFQRRRFQETPLYEGSKWRLDRPKKENHSRNWQALKDKLTVVWKCRMRSSSSQRCRLLQPFKSSKVRSLSIASDGRWDPVFPDSRSCPAPVLHAAPGSTAGYPLPIPAAWRPHFEHVSSPGPTTRRMATTRMEWPKRRRPPISNLQSSSIQQSPPT